MVAPKSRRRVEMRKLLYTQFGLPLLADKPMWFLSDRFWEAAGAPGDFSFSPAFLDALATKPAEAMFDFLTSDDEGSRKVSVEWYEKQSRDVLSRIQERRDRLARETMKMRRKAASVLAFCDTQDDLLDEAAAIGLNKEDLMGQGDAFMRSFIRKVPCSHISVELGLKLEGEETELSPHDFHDINFMSAALPYADFVVTEKQFANRALQAGLTREYPAKVLSSLSSLADRL
ncbi:hypothetical protein OL67_003022 [Phaeobacter piscinae]|nr:hypothetical protein OL67_003022 [Phaeobacter piscinae]